MPAPGAITRSLANTARGAAHFLRETVGRVRYGRPGALARPRALASILFGRRWLIFCWTWVFLV